jgi:hypothetical protein
MESLLGKVRENLPDYKPHELKNLLLLSLCILQAGSVNLYKLRGHVGRILGVDIQASSGYKRLIRIFDLHAYSRLWLDLLLYGFRLLRLKSDYLLLDGTSWKRRGVERHYLTLSILYQGVAIPIYWVDLGRLGISSERERKKIFRRVFKCYDLSGKTLLADREYIGKEWFKYLQDQGLDFIIRLRKNNYRKAINACDGKSWEEMERKVLNSKLPNKALGKRVTIDGREYSFVLVKNPDAKAKDKVVYLLSTLEAAAVFIAGQYLLRWGIECCFRHLKSNGFQLEQINLKGKARSKLLMAVVVFAYVLSIHEGLKKYKNVRLIRKADGTSVKAESVFRNGWDNLIAKIPTFEYFLQYVVENINEAAAKYRSQIWLRV